MSEKIRIGIIGTGGMAHTHVDSFMSIKSGDKNSCEIVAACDINEDVVKAFSDTHEIQKTYTDYKEILKDKNIDAVSIVAIDKMHAPISLAALEAGKHVFCEKPLALNYTDALCMLEAAKKSAKIHMVNFSYRNSSAIQKAKLMVESGELGEIVHVEASYLQSWLSSKCWGDWKTSPALLWRLSSEHGSKGTLGDIGVHIIDFASFPVGPIERVYCDLKTFEHIKGTQQNEYRLDANDTSIITTEFANGAMGSITATRWATGKLNSLTLSVYGTKGSIRIDLDNNYDTLDYCDEKNKDISHWHTVWCEKTPTNHERFINSIKTGIQDVPDFNDGAQVQRVLDACFISAEKKTPVLVSDIE